MNKKFQTNRFAAVVQNYALPLNLVLRDGTGAVGVWFSITSTFGLFSRSASDDALIGLFYCFRGYNRSKHSIDFMKLSF